MHRRDALRVLGTAGLVALTGCGESGTDSGEDTPQRTETDGGDDTPQRTETRETADPSPENTATPRRGTVRVDVGPGTFFRPASILIEQGTTVRWVWLSDNHNVSVSEQPEDASWDGHIPIEDTGFEYEHEFTIPGTYRYYCEPHVRDGMTGDVTVR
jgi:plastocyanin